MKYLQPRRIYRSFGKKFFFETLIFSLFILFFMGL